MFCTSYNLLRSERQNAEGGLSWKHWRLERELLSRCCRTWHLIGLYLIDDLYCPVDGCHSDSWWRSCQIIWQWSRKNGVKHYWDSRIKGRLLCPVTELQNARADFWAWTNFSVPGWHRIRYPSSWQGGCNRTLCWLVVRYCKLIELIGYRYAGNHRKLWRCHQIRKSSLWRNDGSPRTGQICEKQRGSGPVQQLGRSTKSETDDVPKWKLKEVLAVHELFGILSLGFQLYHAPGTQCQFTDCSMLGDFAISVATFTGHAGATLGATSWIHDDIWWYMDTSCSCCSITLHTPLALRRFFDLLAGSKGFAIEQVGKGRFATKICHEQVKNIQHHPAIFI